MDRCWAFVRARFTALTHLVIVGVQSGRLVWSYKYILPMERAPHILLLYRRWRKAWFKTHGA